VTKSPSIEIIEQFQNLPRICDENGTPIKNDRD